MKKIFILFFFVSITGICLAQSTDLQTLHQLKLKRAAIVKNQKELSDRIRRLQEEKRQLTEQNDKLRLSIYRMERKIYYGDKTQDAYEKIKNFDEEKADAERKAEQEKQLKLEAERKKKAEEKRINDEARNKVANAFGKSNSNSKSEGYSGGSGNQGYPTGDPNSKNRSGSGLGNSGSGFSLSGRSLDGALPEPNYGIQEEGIVVVQVTVNKYGHVVAAVYQFKGTTTQNSTLKRAAIEAAKKAKFNSDKNASAFQKGTITYHFELH